MPKPKLEDIQKQIRSARDAAKLTDAELTALYNPSAPNKYIEKELTRRVIPPIIKAVLKRFGKKKLFYGLVKLYFEGDRAVLESDDIEIIESILDAIQDATKSVFMNLNKWGEQKKFKG
jgi:hypothetical protein